jgi:hypothetical protein
MTTTVTTQLLRIDLPPVIPNGLQTLFKLNSSNVVLDPTTVPILIQPHISSNATAYRTLAHEVNAICASSGQKSRVVQATLLVVLAASTVPFVIGLVGHFFKMKLGNVPSLAWMAASLVLDILASIFGYMVLANINRRRAAALERACATFSSSSDQEEQDFDGTGGVMTVHYTPEQTDTDPPGQLKTQAYLEFRCAVSAPTYHDDDDNNNNKNPFLPDGGAP